MKGNTTKFKIQILPSNHQIPNPKESGQEKIYDIRDRTFLFGKRILEIGDLLPKNNVGDILKVQLLRSGTSIGANVEESDGSLTKRDFTNKLVLARKEAKETHYWLRLIADKFVDEKRIFGDIQEAQEIINILSAIINKTKDSRKLKFRSI